MQEPLRNRMQKWEAAPPKEAWQQIAAALSEMNAESRLSQRMHAQEFVPPAGTWNTIREELKDQEPQILPKKPAPVKRLYPLVFRYGAVALVAGLLTWVFIGQPAEAPNKPVADTKAILPANPGKLETATVSTSVNIAARDKRMVKASTQKSGLFKPSVTHYRNPRDPHYAVQHFTLEEDSHLLAVVRPIAINRGPNLLQHELPVQQKDPRYILVNASNGQPVRLSAKFAPLYYAMSGQNAESTTRQMGKLLKKLRKQVSRKPFVPDPYNHLDMMQLTDLLRR